MGWGSGVRQTEVFLEEREMCSASCNATSGGALRQLLIERPSKWQGELQHFIPKSPKSVSHSILPWKRQRSSCLRATWRLGVTVSLGALQQAEEQEMRRNKGVW